MYLPVEGKLSSQQKIQIRILTMFSEWPLRVAYVSSLIILSLKGYIL